MHKILDVARLALTAALFFLLVPREAQLRPVRVRAQRR